MSETLSPSEVAKEIQGKALKAEIIYPNEPLEIIAGAMLDKASLVAKSLSQDYPGIRIDSSANFSTAMKPEDIVSYKRATALAVYSASALGLKKAGSTGMLRDTDLTSPLHTAFEGTIVTVPQGEFSYELRQREMDEIRNVEIKEDRSLGYFFEEEGYEKLPPYIKGLIDLTGTLPEIRGYVLPIAKQSIAMLAKERAKASEMDTAQRVR